MAGSKRSNEQNSATTNGSLPRFDPKTLLNPKGAMQRSRTGDHEVISAHGDSTRPTTASNFASDSHAERKSPDDTKWGSMIERVHNVGNREDQPRKRQKTEQEIVEDEEEAKKKAHFAGGGGDKGTEIGAYLKEKRNDGAKSTGPQDAVVDLTAEVDDDVILVKDTADRQVCLGRLQDARVNAHKVPSQRPGGFQGSSGQWPVMKVNLRRRPGANTHIIAVIDPCGTDFGTVDPRTALALAPLMDNAEVNKLRVQARLEMRKKYPGQSPGQYVSESYQLSILLYSPRKVADGIGRWLSQRQIWLRTPIGSDRNIDIYNPHLPPAARPVCTGVSGLSSGGQIAYSTRTKEEVRSDVLSVFDSIKHSDTLPETEPDSRVKTPLLRHQKQGLTFMRVREGDTQDDDEENEQQEGSLWKTRVLANGRRVYDHVLTGRSESVRPPPVLGGILADMMGLGKTLSVLAVVVGSLDQSRKWLKQKPPQKSSDGIQLKRNAATTLLVCPLSTVANWEEQIKAHIEEGALSYHIYHGSSRTKDVDELSKYKVVITTYSIVASEFSRDPLRSPLQQINWFRIVLDEAHMIREQSTQQSKAACSLSAQRRWAVTGTPVQNRLDDLGALIKFLRIKPFDDKGQFAQYILAPFKSADPEILPKLRVLVDSITLRRLKDRIDLPSKTDQIVELQFSDSERGLYEWFARYSDQKVQAVAGNTRNSKIGARVYAHILRAILRLRLICAHGQELLSDDDMKLLDGYTQSTAIDLEEEDQDKPALTEKDAFDMLYLLRESDMDRCANCNNKIGKENPDEDLGRDIGDDEVTGHMLPCYQIFCPQCITKARKEVSERQTPDNFVTCPYCGQYVRAVFYDIWQSKAEKDEEARERAKENPKVTKHICRYGGPHTKTRALIQDLNLHKEWSNAHPDEPPIKSVVFSAWTTHLDLIQVALEDAGFPFVRLDGKMTRAKRSLSLTVFRDDPTVPVILVSLMAGGLGLNLTSASRVYVMEPQFNPAAEQQAVDRVHRLGQKREVVISRFIMKDSFEEKMLVLQRKKQNLADLSLDRTAMSKIDREEAAKKKLEELRSLFR